MEASYVSSVHPLPLLFLLSPARSHVDGVGKHFRLKAILSPLVQVTHLYFRTSIVDVVHQPQSLVLISLFLCRLLFEIRFSTHSEAFRGRRCLIHQHINQTSVYAKGLRYSHRVRRVDRWCVSLPSVSQETYMGY